MEQLTPGAAIDRYVVEDVLGAGAMAVVYRVRHRDLGTEHALKVLGLVSDGVRARALQEGRIQGSLRHPNIVAVTDVVQVGGSPALVMEYVAGPSLASWLAHARPSIAQIDALAQDVLRGLAAAHRAAFVHRDLKPANVLLAPVGDAIVAKVADFGLAKVVAEDGTSRTRTGTTMGTPAYMAPEQFRNAKDVDARADVFAAGATLYELATGCLAIEETDFIECFRAASEQRWVPVRKRAPALPDRMVRAIEAAMQPDPSARPADADALLRIWRGEEAGGAFVPVVADRVWTTGDREQVASLAPRPAPAVSQPTREWAPPAPASVVPSPAPPPAASRAGLVLAGGAGILAAGALALAAVLGVAAWLTARSPDVPEAPLATPVPEVAPTTEAAPTTAAAAPAEPAPVAPAPVEAAAPAPSTASRPHAASRPAAAPVEAAAPAEAPVAPVEAPAPSPAPEAAPDNVSVLDAGRAYLVTASGQQLSPGHVPPGDYTLVAYFGDITPTRVRDVRIEAGKRYVYRCSATSRNCKELVQ